MLFQGSAHVGTNDHFAHLQKIGGVANGSTSYDRTNYYETVPAHNLELALWLESDRMGHLWPAMTSEKLENQREVVMNERRQRVDNQPYGRAFETLNEQLFPAGHPYHWPVIGYMADIAAATLDDVLIQDTHLQVVDSLARNPNLLMHEMMEIVRKKNLLPHTLEMISKDPRWSNADQVKILVATHRNSSLATAERSATGLTGRLLNQLLNSPNLHPALKSRLVRQTRRGR